MNPIWETKPNAICGIPCDLPNVCWTPRLLTQPDMCWPQGFDPDNIPPTISFPYSIFLALIILIFLGAFFSGIFIGSIGKAVGRFFGRFCCAPRVRAPLRRVNSNLRASFRRANSAFRNSFRQWRQPAAPPPNLPPANPLPDGAHFEFYKNDSIPSDRSGVLPGGAVIYHIPRPRIPPPSRRDEGSSYV